MKPTSHTDIREKMLPDFVAHGLWEEANDTGCPDWRHDDELVFGLQIVNFLQFPDNGTVGYTGSPSTRRFKLYPKSSNFQRIVSVAFVKAHGLGCAIDPKRFVARLTLSGRQPNKIESDLAVYPRVRLLAFSDYFDLPQAPIQGSSRIVSLHPRHWLKGKERRIHLVGIYDFKIGLPDASTDVYPL